MNKYFFTLGKVCLILLSLLIVSHITIGQQSNKITLKGLVLDKSTHLPIEFAVGSLMNNNHIGDVTDDQGYFEIQFPFNFSDDSLSIYLLGYENLNRPIFTLDLEQDTLVFYLKRKSFLLDDIVVEAEGVKLKEMVLQAFSSIPKNFPNKKHQLSGFYRKLSTEEDQYTHLYEAAVTIDDYSYSKPAEDIRLSVKGFRQTEDWGDTDSLMVHMLNKLNESFSNKFGTSQNPLYQLYTSEYLRVHKTLGTHFDIHTFKKYIGTYLFELADVTITESDTLYKIAFGSNRFTDKPSGNSFFIINASDHAIVEFQIMQGFSKDYIINQVHVEFQKIDGRYYPQFIERIIPRLINRDMEDREYDIETYWFDSVKTKDFKKIKYKNTINRFDIDEHEDGVYDAEFWKDYEPMQQHPLSESEKSGLEIHGPIEDQFKKPSDE